MLRVAEHYSGTDTGRQRRANEDSLLARSPLFVVADGMGGAQAGEVASRIAVESFDNGLAVAADPQESLAAGAHAANARIHELSQSNAEQAGMGTTLTAMYVGEHDVAIAHVGDSRAYCLRDGELLRLTDDHSLVDELIRQGKLTPEEAEDHPQRSIITRALGPEAIVEVDTRSYRGRAGDVYLLCSDGLTTMVPEARVAEVLRANPRLRDAGEALIATANEAGGRDNITVILLRLEDVAVAGADEPADEAQTGRHATQGGQRTKLSSAPPGAATRQSPVVAPRSPRQPAGAAPSASRGRRRVPVRRALAPLLALAVLGVLLAGAYVASQSVYFLGTNGRGLVTLFRGVPYELPGGVRLYRSDFVSGVSAATLSAMRRRTLLDHSLRSENDATALMRSLELGQLSEG
ncbi:MAG TPA: Stp1/IreP family PP2C-type Ser/Thr phosphatase [Solirubrobacteraceae bacterium]|jgi:protein phosphatase